MAGIQPNLYDTSGDTTNQRQPQNLLKFTKEQRKQFLDSFDTVLCDCDGVVWKTMQQPIPGVHKGIAFLKSIGKRIIYVTNNSIRSSEEYVEKFKQSNIDVSLNDVVHPVVTIIEYLQKIKFSGLIYCVATKNFKRFLENAGYRVIDGPNKILEETFSDLAKNIMDKEPVKAVIIDVDFNLSGPKLMRAHLYLKNPDCIFIGGAADMTLSFGDTDNIGSGAYIKIVEESSRRKATILGKPGKMLGDMIIEKYNIKSPERILFIGDTLETDARFGRMCGFQTLLVLSGAIKLETLRSHKDSKEIPDYYTESLVDFSNFL